MVHISISNQVIGTAIDVRRRLGPGLLESTYRIIMGYELRKKGLAVLEEFPVPVVWEDIRVAVGFRADLIVNQSIVVELKSVDAIHPVHRQQLLTYLRLLDMRVGLLINFNVVQLKDGIRRVVNHALDDE